MIIKNLTKEYTTITNEIIIDEKLSAGAFRLYCYLASKPETWEVNNNDIKKQLKIGSKDTLSKYWRELIDAGWIEKSKAKDKNGKFNGKTILILNNSRNPKNTEILKSGISQKSGNPKNTDILKSGKHSNTDYISNTEYNSKTDIKEKNIKKEKNFFDEVLENVEVQVLLKELQVDKTFLQSLIAYREKIKPIKTIAGLKKVLKDLRDTRLQSKKSAYELFEIMQENEWLTIKSDYIKTQQKDLTITNKTNELNEEINESINGFLEMAERMGL